MPAIIEHHDKIVECLTNAVRLGTVTTNKTVAESHSTVHPDIVIEKDNAVTIIDVCCPFENGKEVVEEASARKEVKYEHLQSHFEAQSKSCAVFGFAVGALGAMNVSSPPLICHPATRTSSENFVALMLSRVPRTSIAINLGAMMSSAKLLFNFLSLVFLPHNYNFSG